jgi:hypothetical protein
MRITVRFAVIALVALAAFLMLRSSSVKAPSQCESPDACCQKACKTPPDGNLIWETFSRQFIAIGF